MKISNLIKDNYRPLIDRKTYEAKNISKRSLTRLIAVQLFYQHEFYKRSKNLDELKNCLIDNYLLNDLEENPTSYRNQIDIDLLNKLVFGLCEITPKIDEEIKSFLVDENQLNSIPDVLLQIIRLASFELKYMRDIPLKVILNEYVDITGCFYEIQRVRFANGILENIARNYREEELFKIKNEKEQ